MKLFNISASLAMCAYCVVSGTTPSDKKPLDIKQPNTGLLGLAEKLKAIKDTKAAIQAQYF